MNHPPSMLLIRPSALGDVCRSVPVLASLRRAYPEARIDWLVQKEFADAIWHHPGLSEPVLFDRRQIGRDLMRGRPAELLRLLGKLRRARYDVVIDAQGLARSALLGRVSGARQRIGYAAPEAREGAWRWYTRRVRVDSNLHAVERMLALASAAGAEPVRDMRLYTGPPERVWAEDVMRGRRYVLLAPTSRWPGKRWPAERFAQLALGLLERRAVEAAVVVGSATERGQIAALLELAGRHASVIDVTGQTTVGQLMALVQGAAVVVGSDSAALHMAVGFERALVGLYGPTRVELVGPCGRAADVIQHVREGDVLDHKDEARGREMMERISVEEVLAAVVARAG
jgi:heptosyltransferase I